MNHTRHIPALLLIIALLTTPACGRKGQPQPPIKVQPQGSRALTAVQHGNNITLSWTLPEENTDQSSLVGVAQVELFRYTEMLEPEKEGEEEETATDYDALDQVTQSFLAESAEDDGMYGAGYGTGAMAGSGDGVGGKYGSERQPGTGNLGGSGTSRSGRDDGRDGWSQQQQQRAPRITPGFRNVSGEFVSARKFKKNAELIHSLSGSQIQDPGATDRLYFTDPLPEMDEETLELTRYHYAVRVIDTLDREGLFSEFHLVTPLEPPAAPDNLVVQSLERSIDLTWDGPPVNPWVRIAREGEERALGIAGDGAGPGIPAAPGGGKAAAAGAKGKMAAGGGKAAPSEETIGDESDVTGPPEDAVVPGWIVQPPATFGEESTMGLIALWPDPWPVGPRRPVPPYIAGYFVFRQLESDEGIPTVPSQGQPLIEGFYSNRLFTFGETYRFIVRTVMVTEDGRVESESSPPISVTTVDVYPPITPVNFTYVAGAGEVTLIWTPNGEPDLLGYNVYRQKGAGETVQGEPVLLNGEPLSEPRFKDATVLPETWYTYRVGAMDSTEPANRSEFSEPLAVMAR